MLPYLKAALQKAASYCAYQERCHKEVFQKLRDLKLTEDEAYEVIAELIQENYLNEERYACLFARSKFNQKKWGKIRIKRELEFKDISSRNILLAMKEIDPEKYYETLESLLNKKHILEHLKEKDLFKLKKKVCDYALRRGFESSLTFNVYSDLFE